MRQLITFGAVGALNTVLGYAVIFACMYLLGLEPVPSNGIGYAVGLAASFVLNKRITFRSSGRARTELVRFLLAFALAYVLNLTVLLLATEQFGLHAALAQIAGGVAYVSCSYLLSKHFVFLAAPSGGRG